MSNYDPALQNALTKAAEALGRDRGKRNESLAERIIAIRRERNEALTEVRRLRTEVRQLRHGAYTTAPGQISVDRILRDSEKRL